MNDRDFDRQMDRLKCQWPNSYSEERKARLAETWINVDAKVFEEMVDLAIDTLDRAPLAFQFAQLEDRVKMNRSRNRLTDTRSTNSVLSGALDPDFRAQKPFVQDCLELIHGRFDGKISMPDFLEKCKLLEESLVKK